MDTLYTILIIAALITIVEPGFWIAIALVLLYSTLFIPAILVTLSNRTNILANSALYRALDWYATWTMDQIDALNRFMQDRH